MPKLLIPGLKLDALLQTQIYARASKTYQRFTCTLEHIANILMYPRFCSLPTNKTKVINMFYALGDRKKNLNMVAHHQFRSSLKRKHLLHKVIISCDKDYFSIQSLFFHPINSTPMGPQVWARSL